MCIEPIELEMRVCPCGCEQPVPVYIGTLHYGEENFVNFTVTHMEQCSSGPHVWLMLGSGSWFADDDRNCWVTLHLYSDKENIITRVSDPKDSPFWRWKVDDDRYLSRDEVLAQDGGKEWAIERRLDFEEHHSATAQFLHRHILDNDPSAVGEQCC